MVARTDVAVALALQTMRPGLVAGDLPRSAAMAAFAWAPAVDHCERCACDDGEEGEIVGRKKRNGSGGGEDGAGGVRRDLHADIIRLLFPGWYREDSYPSYASTILLSNRT